MKDSFRTRTTLDAGGQSYEIHSLDGHPGSRRRPPALLAQDPAREPAAIRGRRQRHARRHRGAAALGSARRTQPRDRLHAGARDHAGLHRRPRHRRPRGDARGDDPARRQSAGDQSARPGGARDRPFRAGRRVRHAGFAASSNNAIEFAAQRRALCVPALGADGVQQLQGRAAEHRHRSPGQSRAPRARGLRRRAQRRASRVSRHAGRHRFAHHDGQRPRRARLGRRRHRGGSRDAGPGRDDAHPAGDRLPAQGRAPGGCDGDGPRAHGHRDAAQEGRRRQVRRVLRRRARGSAAGRSRNDREHVAGVRQHLRDLSDRRGNLPLPRAHRPQRGADRARRGLCPGAGDVAHERHARGRVQRRRSSSISRASSPVSRAPSARRTACRCARRRPPTARASRR